MDRWGEEVERLLQDRAFLLLGLTSFVSITGVTLISPALPAIADGLAVEESRIGLVVTAFTLPAIFILPLSGFVADNFGRRRIMSAGCLCIGLGGLVGYFAPGFGWLLAGRVLQGVGYAGVMPLTVTLIGDLYEGNEESEAQGLRTSSIKAGSVLWPVVGGALAAVAWNDVFLAYLLFVPLAGLLWVGLPTVATEQEGAAEYAQSLAHIAERPHVAMFLSIGFVRFFLLYAFLTYLPLLLTSRYAIGSGAVGPYVAVLGVGGMISATTSGLFDQRFRKTSTIVASFFLIGVASLVVLSVGHFVVAVVAVLLVGLAESLVGPLHHSLVTQHVDEEHRAGIVTLNSVIQNVGKTVAPVALGAVLFLGDHAWLYGAAALAFVGGAGLLLARRALE